MPKKAQSPSRPRRRLIPAIRDEMAKEGDAVSISQLCRWTGLARSTFYYQEKARKPKVNEWLASRIKRVIDALPYAGYRTVAFMLGENKNTVQRLMSLKGWQCRKRAIGFRPRVKAKASVAHAPDMRWSTDIARVWCGEQARWAALTLVMDCHTREVLGWSLSKRGNAKSAVAALEDALLTRYGVIGKATPGLQLRSDNGLVFTSRLYTTLAMQYGLTQEFIQPHTPQQNGMVERLIRTIKEQCIWMHNFTSMHEART
ncbi:IS3 family transposase, partial [Vibrio agarilyticus]|uniref:IS3 family transposase n=1 Tax=Vibrio agarilyticus TaxID=2726741 RepID=UPI0031B5658C